MNGRRILGALALTLRFLGRALVGATAGLIVVFWSNIILGESFRRFFFEGDDAGAQLFWTNVLRLGAALSAFLAAIFGKSKLKGKFGAVIKGGLAGAVAGSFIGMAIGSTQGEGKLQMNWMVFGLFLGGSLGLIVGGILGVRWDTLWKDENAMATKGTKPDELKNF